MRKNRDAAYIAWRDKHRALLTAHDADLRAAFNAGWEERKAAGLRALHEAGLKIDRELRRITKVVP